MWCKIIRVILIISLLISIIFYIMSRKPITRHVEKYTKKIPYVLYKTGPFKKDNIPEDISNAMNISKKNLKAQIVYFDNEQSRDFIKNNFDDEVLNAYDSLIPSAYKADLWRYCIIYKNGGIYSDLSQTILQEFDVNENDCDILFALDRQMNKKIKTPIQISFIAAKPKNEFFRYLIRKVVENVNNKYIPDSSLEITGPAFAGKLFRKFFSTDKLMSGVNTYIGKDLQEHVINTPFMQIDGAFMIKIGTKQKMIKLRTGKHFKQIYDKNNIHYSKLHLNAWKTKNPKFLYR